MSSSIEASARSESAADRRTGQVPLGATGAAFAVLVVVGNAIYTEGGPESLGYGIELLGYVGLAVFVAWIATTFRAERQPAAMVSLIGGVAMLAVKLAGWAAVLASKQATLAPEVAAGLVEIDERAFVLAWLPFGLLIVGVSLAALQAGRLPRSVAWVGVVLGVGCMLAVPLSSTEPFVLPWLISLLWLVVASTLLARGRGRGDQAWSVEV
jgi:hypothetical protein